MAERWITEYFCPVKDFQNIFDKSLKMHSMGVENSRILNYIATESQKLLDEGSAVSILLIDKTGKLRNGASPSLPQDYLRAIDGIAPDPNIGTCAAAAATGNVVVTQSFLADDKWSELKHFPLSLGYSGAWSVPIKNDQNVVLGTIGVYQKDIKSPPDLTVEGIQLLSSAAGQILSAATRIS